MKKHNLPVFALLLMTACGPDKPDSGVIVEDTGQTDACEPTQEVPYDGLDQDCDGSDLTDVDGDGFDAEQAGGADCDDHNAAAAPGAPETPYDGIDQDCDGADLIDVDGDGYEGQEAGGGDCDDLDVGINPSAAEVCDELDNDCDGLVDGFDPDITGTTTWYADEDEDGYGDPNQPREACSEPANPHVQNDDDCDDGDAAVNPDAGEASGDGIDNNCDGFVDEVPVCADGSGAFSTIQEAVDGSADGSTLVLCPGTYSENVTIEDRIIDIVGGGESPDEVVIAGTTEKYGTFLLEGADLSLSNLTIQAAANKAAIRAEDGNTLSVDLVDFCAGGYVGNDYVFYTDSAKDVTSISRSRFCDAEILAVMGVATVVGNVFDGTGLVLSGSASPGTGSEGEFSVSNNVFVGGTIFVRFNDAGEATINNNTFAYIAGFSINVSVGQADAYYMPPIKVHDNIISNCAIAPASGSVGEGALWAVSWYGYSDMNYGHPQQWEQNIVWETEGNYGILCLWDDDVWDYVCEPESLGEWIADRSIDADPLFAWNADLGTYALGSGSPAIDAGIGDPDVDGSPNDLGAFGGPGGDWWKDVSWLP